MFLLTMDLTRRHFLGVSSLFLCNGLFHGLSVSANFSCSECNAVNLFTDRCFSCGRGLTKGLKCSNCAKGYNCLVIPFPNHRYLIDTDKPPLTMAAVNF